MFFVTVPFLLYRKNAKRTLTSIEYHLGNNQMELTTYRKELLRVDVGNLTVRYNEKKPKIVHEL